MSLQNLTLEIVSTETQSLSSEAIAQLVGAHRDFLAFLERRVESRAVAEDILQTAFVRTLDHGADVSEEKVIAWFYRVLRNAVIDHYRHRSSSAKALEELARSMPDPETPEVQNEICQCVSRIVDTLKPEYREALRVVDLEDHKLTELAATAGISPDNAAVRIHRARKALREKVQQACGSCAEHGCLNCTCQSNSCGTARA